MSILVLILFCTCDQERQSGTAAYKNHRWIRTMSVLNFKYFPLTFILSLTAFPCLNLSHSLLLYLFILLQLTAECNFEELSKKGYSNVLTSPPFPHLIPQSPSSSSPPLLTLFSKSLSPSAIMPFFTERSELVTLNGLGRGLKLGRTDALAATHLLDILWTHPHRAYTSDGFFERG